MKNIKMLVLMGAVIVFSIVALTVGAHGGESYLSYIPISLVNNCLNWPTATPAGALPGQPPPVFCMINNFGPGTEQPGQNSWYDDFDHGLSFANFENTQYQFDEVGAWRTMFWRHAEHWMVDMAPTNQDGSWQWVQGYALMRPNQTFQFSNGRLIVETTVAAGMEAYGDQAWPEIVITTGPEPIDQYISLYAFDLFPEHWTLGCRLQSTRVPICALKANDGGPNTGSTRIWEMSFWQLVGTTNYGGGPFNGLENYWHVCELDDPDVNCRDHFRLELTATSLTLYVNGVKYFEQTGIPPLPNELVNGNLYVYLSSSQTLHQADTVRYHWDLFTINNPVPISQQLTLFNTSAENICLIPSDKTSKDGLYLSK